MHHKSNETGGTAFAGTPAGPRSVASGHFRHEFILPNIGRERKRQDREPVQFRDVMVGYIVNEAGRRVFVRHVRRDKDLYRVLDGTGLHLALLADLKGRGVTHIRNVWDDGIAEIATLSAYHNHGIAREWKGPQLVLGRRYFDHERSGTPSRPRQDSGHGNPAGTQLRLLEVAG